MNEQLLFAYLQEHGDFAQWVALYPLLADRVVSALITLNSFIPICVPWYKFHLGSLTLLYLVRDLSL